MKKQIYNCPPLFANECPKTWPELKPTENEQRRYCSVCENTVHECEMPDDFVRLGSMGKCVAIPEHVIQRLQEMYPPGYPMMMGVPSKSALKKMQDDMELVQAWLNALESVNRRTT